MQNQTRIDVAPASGLDRDLLISADGRHSLSIVAGVARFDDREVAREVVAAALVERGAWLIVRDAAAGHSLVRVAASGGSLAHALGDLGDHVAVQATRTGERLALISGERELLARETAAGALAIEVIGPRTADRRILLGGRGVFEHTGAAVVRRSGGPQLALPPDLAQGAVTAGALLHDGAGAAIEVDVHGQRHVIVYDLASGAPRKRFRIGDAALVAVPERRGVLVIARGRQVEMLDARTGACAHACLLRANVRRMSTTADGTRYVALDADGRATELGSRLENALEVDAREASEADAPAESAPAESAPVTEQPTAAAVAPADPSLPADAVAPADPSLPADADADASPDDDSPILAALWPPRAGDSLSEPMRREFLDDMFALVAAWCERATLAGSGAGDADVAAARARETTAAERSARWSAAGGPLDAIAADFGLSPIATAILFVAAAPQLWGELARAYAAITADPTRPLVDELLVCQMLDVARADRGAVARELDDGAPLVRHGLLAIGAGSRPFAALDVPNAIVRRIAGHELVDQTTRRAPDRALHEIFAPRAELDALVRELSRPSVRPARVVVRGRSGTGRRTLAAALAACAGRALGLVEITTGPLGDVLARLRRDLRDVHARGWIACVSGVDHAELGDSSARDQVRAVLDAHPGPLFVRCTPTDTAPLAPGHAAIDLTLPSGTERVAVWRWALAGAGLPDDAAEDLARSYAVGPGIALRMAEEARAMSGDATSTAIGARIERALRERRAERLGRFATRVDALASWDSLVLPEEMIDSVRELVGRVRLSSLVLDTWGMAGVASTARSVAALFQGAPGTGKTLVAGVIARELGYELYRVDLSKVVSKWLGETEKNLGAVFDAAEDGRCILLFDEADSLFGKRTDVRSSHDRNANLEVNYLLQRLDSFEGIALLTTNFGTAIDPAFKRRLSLHLQFPFPDVDERERLWRRHLPRTLPVAGDLDLPGLARKYELSGGYIRNAALRAAYLAAAEHGHVTGSHLRRAVEAEYRDRGKLAAAGGFD